MRRTGAVAGQARSGLVLMHGRGSNSADILGLVPHLALPQVAAIAPDAPGGSWWPVSFLAPSSQMEPHLVRAVAEAGRAVQALEDEGLPRSRIWLAGFSQGAVLALEAFARQGQGLAGAFGLSGALAGTGDATGGPDAALYGHGPKRFDYEGSRSGSKVWISVHSRDPHIPVKRVEESVTVLKGLGAEVQSLIYPGAGHSVMQDDIVAMRRWLND
ncbi:phospholipase [Tabrizicola sp. J26]|uniref:alpha/beta hydrolase n=1 Tax=Alitabrizicola rongguiensis TaxID=2909234 RepID=UPI001F1D084B|nr:phospholipase [Tabrizicola rongguiensis]MCF1710633.1 phospholipase [Tabrizicola rongguiensis]